MAEKEKDVLNEKKACIGNQEKLIERIRQTEKIYSLNNALKQTEQNIRRTENSLQKLQEKKQELQSNIQKKKEQADLQEKKLKDKEPEWTEEILKIKDSLEKYEQLEKILKELENSEKILANKKRTIGELEGTLKHCEKEKQWAKQIKNENANCEVRKVELDYAYAQVQEQEKALEKLMQKSKGLSNLLESCIKLQDEAKKWKNRYLEASSIYEKVYQVFLNEQAGILARNLEEGMPCPVCGALNHPDINKGAIDAPTQQEVQNKKELRDQLEQKRDQAAVRYQESAQKYTTERQVFAEKVLELTGTPLNENEPRLIQEVYHSKQVERKSLADEREKILKDVVLYKKAEEKLQMLEKQEKETQESLEIEKQKSQQMAERVQVLKVEFKTRSEGMMYSSKEEALSVLRQFEKELAYNQKLLENYRTDYQVVVEEERHIDGQLLNGQAGLKDMKIRLKEEKELFEQKLNQFKITQEEFWEFIKKLNDLPEIEKEVREYYNLLQQNAGRLKSLKDQLGENSLEDIEELKMQAEKIQLEHTTIKNRQMYLFTTIQKNKECRERLEKNFLQSGNIQKKYEVISNLSRTANGSLSGTVKMDFETYVQRKYFKQIIQAANKRLVQMTSGEFILQCRDVKNLGSQGQAGLDLDVYHMVSDSVRDVKTLSGGESFMASLSMALGLADIVQNAAGGIRLETMFVDEGFGSLDDVAREQAIKVLTELAGKERLVGIISHVNELKEQIDIKLMVTKTEKGSKAKWID